MESLFRNFVSPQGCIFTFLFQKRQKQPPEMSVKKGVVKSFANFTEKHLRWSLFLIKLQFLRTPILLKPIEEHISLNYYF